MNKDSVPKKLAASFRELVKKSSVEKITIKEITDGAGLIRPTFYHHFKDKYDPVSYTHLLWTKKFPELSMIPEKIVQAHYLSASAEQRWMRIHFCLK